MTQTSGFFVLAGPLVPAPLANQTRAAHLQGFARIVGALGAAPRAILERHGIDPRALDDPDSYVGCDALLETIAYCAQELGEPLFGLTLARFQSADSLGLLAPLCRAAPDVGTALRCLCDYAAVIQSPECILSLEVGPATCELTCASRSEPCSLEQMTYGAFHTLLALLRDLGRGDFRPQYILTRYAPRASEREAMEQLFGCPVRTRQDRNAIGFSRHVLGRPLASADRVTFRLLSDYVERVRGQQRLALVERVEDFVRGHLDQGCTLPRCAAALGLSARALQLKLDEFGATFSQILDAEREGVARALLASDEHSLDEVALRLGYAEQTSFGRAFRRWTGLSPGSFREGNKPGRAIESAVPAIERRTDGAG
jgi:AraC-like DNA-binding protein